MGMVVGIVLLVHSGCIVLKSREYTVHLQRIVPITGVGNPRGMWVWVAWVWVWVRLK